MKWRFYMDKNTGFAVVFYLKEDEIQRLEKIVKVFKEKGVNFSMESAFEFIMLTGSRYIIDEKMTFCEKQLGIKEW